MEKNNQIFDNYEVDCNTCESYWNSQCDGVKIEDRRKCNSYIATRDIDVVKELGKCKEKIKGLQTSQTLLGIGILVYLLGEIVSRCLT